MAFFQGLRNGLRLLRPRARFELNGSHRSLTRCTPFLSYLVLLRVGFAMPRALLHGRCALTAPFHPYRNSRTSQAPRLAPALPSRPAQSGSACAVHLSAAVSSLWHFPSNGLQAILPDVIRHTALRSSDFPLSW